MSVEKARKIIESYDGPSLRLMEVCGTHTHEIFRLGVRNLMPDSIELISGPGCPVCVTQVGFIDEAVMLALDKGCTICSFGDLLRVPGTEMSLAEARARGADVRVVYMPLDAVKIAQENPDLKVVFLAVGFETTTPISCIAVEKAAELGLENFSLLTANKTMPQAYAALRDSADAFLYPGHVHAITGTEVCRKLCERDGVSGVVTGFTASELLTAIAVIVKKYQEGKPFFVNAYPRVVREEGNPQAMQLIGKVMEACEAEWRGIGVIPGSGLRLREEYSPYDARKKYDLPEIKGRSNPACRCGDVLRGEIKPYECAVFGKVCTPQHPVGACMVSSEGACSAYYQYGGHNGK